MLKDITLEISLKPFRQTDPAAIRQVCRQVYADWRPLLKDAERVGIMLWAADGSEILDYRGKMEDAFEWCYFVGGANNLENQPSWLDPECKGLHTRNYLYMQDPPTFTYRDLAQVVLSFKEVGKELLGLPVSVGATFDIGPEFARSDFKYRRHREICMGNDMGKATMVCAYATLHGDSVSYAAFPEGIPEGTPFGTFFGAQSREFLKDLGFDFLWLSNGLGFGMEPWSAHGALFDGERFLAEKLEEVREKSMAFWQLFRQECPNIPIRTRGTNMTMGIDFSTDGVPLREIYQGVEGLLSPPNSPWAGLNGNFGLEIAGYLSRMAELPGEEYLFRYYLHDPWWANSPWQDRYGGYPHDIYLPMAACRINGEGSVVCPSHLSILSIDNTWGEMPERCYGEAIPHLQRAEREAPDAPPPFVWGYPFEEISNAKTERELRRINNQDWFIVNAIQRGMPLSGVVSLRNFCKNTKDIYRQSVLVTPVPKAGSPEEEALFRYGAQGGKVLFYGSVTDASEAFLQRFGLSLSEEPFSGNATFVLDGEEKYPITLSPLLCDGGLRATFQPTPGLALRASAEGYALGVSAGNMAWCRGIPGWTRSNIGGEGLTAENFFCEDLAREMLADLGWRLEQKALLSTCQSAVCMLHRHAGAIYLSSYAPDNTVECGFRFPLGMPLFTGYSAEVRDGCARYRFSKAERLECRVLVEQPSGVVSCNEIAPASVEYERRLAVSGLQNATVRFLLPPGISQCGAVLNSRRDYFFVGDPFEGEYLERDGVRYYEARGVTGELVLSLPFPGGNKAF